MQGRIEASAKENVVVKPAHYETFHSFPSSLNGFTETLGVTPDLPPIFLNWPRCFIGFGFVSVLAYMVCLPRLNSTTNKVKELKNTLVVQTHKIQNPQGRDVARSVLEEFTGTFGEAPKIFLSDTPDSLNWAEFAVGLVFFLAWNIRFFRFSDTIYVANEIKNMPLIQTRKMKLPLGALFTLTRP